MKRAIIVILIVIYLFLFAGCSEKALPPEEELAVKERIVEMGIYRLEFSFEMISNDQIGEEWDYYVTYKGVVMENGAEIEAPIGGMIPIAGTAMEKDRIPDIGTEILLLRTDGSRQSKLITVKENRGKYSGNTATWELTASATLLERK